MRFVIAFRAFFAVLFNRERAFEVKHLLEAPPAANAATKHLPGPSGETSETSHLPKSARGSVTESSSGGSSAVTAPATSNADTSKATTAAQNRSDAITLLATLQREARFVDLVQESLDQYTDAQIGAAARDVLRDTKKCLNQMLAIEPLSAEGEGAKVKLPPNPSAVQWKLTGGAKDSGTVVHAGWKVTEINLPTWTGSKEDQRIIAPIEVE